MPRIARNKTAGSGVQQVNADPEVQSFISKQDFWQKMETAFRETPADCSVYIYRQLPKSRMNGSGGYLAILTEPFTEEDIKKRWGGYQFRAMLNRGRTMLAATTFDIEATPKLDAEKELNFVHRPGDPAAGGLSGGGDIRTALEFVQSQLDKSDPANSRALDIIADAAKKANEMLIGQMPKQLSTVEMLAQFAELRKNLAPTTDPIMAALLPELIKKAFAGPADNATSSVEGTLSLVSKIKDMFGGSFAGAAVRTGLADKFIEALPQIVEKAGPLMDRLVAISKNNAEIARFRAMTAGIPAQQPAPANVTTRAIPQAAAPAANGNPPVAAPGSFAPLQTEELDAAAPAPAPMPPGADRLASDLEAFFKFRVVEMIEGNFSGDQVYSFICGANPVLAAMMMNASEVQIREFLASDPVLARAATLPVFDQFLTEMMEYISEEKAQNAAEAITAGAPAQS